MNLSKTKIALFFFAIIMLAWFLYPQDFFLGYIYEGQVELSKAEYQYLQYLKKNPNSKQALLRIANLYDRMSEPDKALYFLKRLYEHRKTDWEIAKKYLDHLQANDADETLYRIEWEVVEEFSKNPRFPRHKLLLVLEDSLERALWLQKFDDAYQILIKLLILDQGKNKEEYVNKITIIDKGLKKTNRLISFLKKRLLTNPENNQYRRDLIDVFLFTQKFKEATLYLNEGLALDPNDYLFLKQKAYVLLQLNDTKKTIQVIGRLLDHKELGNDDKSIFLYQLARLHLKNNNKGKAIAAIDRLIKQFSHQQSLWKDGLGIIDALNNKELYVSYLSQYLKKYPKDNEINKRLVETYLYELKDLGKLEEYQNYMKEVCDRNFAMSVGYALIEADQRQDAHKWLVDAVECFPNDKELYTTIVYNLEDQKNYVMANYWARQVLKFDPGNVELWLLLANNYVLLGKFDEAANSYIKIAALRKNDVEKLVLVGRELFFIERYEAAKDSLYQSLKHKKTNPKAWFWLSEIQMAQEMRGLAKESANQVIVQAAKIRKPSMVIQRMVLRSKGKFGYQEELVQEYQTLINKHPRQKDLRLDFIDCLLNYKKTELAESEIIEFMAKFRKDKDVIYPYRAALFFQKRNWVGAIDLYTYLAQKNPRAWVYRRHLAEAYEKTGEWPTAIDIYEKINNEKKRKEIERKLYFLHEKYDHSVFSEFYYADLGQEDFFNIKTGYYGFLTKKLKVNSHILFGHYQSGTNATTEMVYEGLLSIDYRIKDALQGILGLQGAMSDQRKTPGLLFGVETSLTNNLFFVVEGRYRQLRKDMTAAVQAGALEDRMNLEMRYMPIERLSIVAKYTFNRSYLPDGVCSYGNTLDPLISFMLLQKPFISLGYQFVYSHQSDDGVFLTRVPLIEDMQTHYVMAYLSHDFNSRMTVNGSFFVGEDRKRNLSLFEGDLFGAGLGMKWYATNHLFLEARYNFGQETLLGIGGQSHQLNMQLTWHDL